LIRQEKLAVLGQLAGGIGHELRNPLWVISNAVYFLKMVLSASDEVIREYFDIISQEVEKSVKIISDLLDFSRVKTLEKEEIEVYWLIRSVMERLPASEKKGDYKYSFRVAAGICRQRKNKSGTVKSAVQCLPCHARRW